MNFYNDFPILSNEQYKDLEFEYKKENNSDIFLNEVYGNLIACDKSLDIISNLKSKDKLSFRKELQDINESFIQECPSIQPKNIEPTNNLFLFFNLIINSLKIIEKIKKNKNNQNNYIFIENLRNKLLDLLNLIFSTLSKREFKFFKYL